MRTKVQDYLYIKARREWVPLPRRCYLPAAYEQTQQFRGRKPPTLGSALLGRAWALLMRLNVSAGALGVFGSRYVP